MIAHFTNVPDCDNDNDNNNHKINVILLFLLNCIYTLQMMFAAIHFVVVFR